MSHASASSDRSRRGAGWYVCAAAVVLTAVHWLPTPPPLERGGEIVTLTASGKACLAILGFAVILWISEAVPFAATALAVLLLVPVLGISDYASAVGAGFGNPIITFFIGILILAAAFSRSGLGTRLVLHVLRAVGTRTDRVLLGFLAVGAFLSMWLNDLAVTALMLPLGVGLLEDANLKRLESNFGRALMIACAFGPLIGGIATPAGTGANPVAIAYLRDLADIEISFLKWMAFGMPAAVLMVPCAWYLLLRVFPPEISQLPVTAQDIECKLASLGRLTPVERKTLAVFGTTIALWLSTPLLAQATDGRVDLSMHAVALGGGLSLFLPGINALSWKSAQRDVEWGGILLIAAGLSLGVMVYETGAARWIGAGLLGQFAVVPAVLQPFVVVLVVALLHLLFASNTVTSTIIMPILIALAQDIGVSVWTIAAPAAFTSSLAFILVTESPANVVPYSAGYFSIGDMARVGTLMTVAAAGCITVAVLGIGPIVGSP